VRYRERLNRSKAGQHLGMMVLRISLKGTNFVLVPFNEIRNTTNISLKGTNAGWFFLMKCVTVALAMR
jgi:hypothetical protein